MNLKPYIRAAALLGALTAFAPAFAQTPAQEQVPVTVTSGANLNLTPKRLVLDRGRRSGTVFIYNQGDAAAVFDVGLVDRVMRPDGVIAPLDQASAKPEFQPYAQRLQPASALLLISPRRVSLAPRQGQTVRIRVTGAPQALAPGEYRTHLTITTIPPREAGETADEAARPPSGQLRLTVNAMFGISIPVILRVGETDARAAIENVRLEQEDLPAGPGGGTRRATVAVFDLVRQGTSSLFGNLEVRVAGQRRGESLGAARGLGVYPEIERRSVRIPLVRAPGADERLEITFTDDDASPGKVLAKSAP